MCRCIQTCTSTYMSADHMCIYVYISLLQNNTIDALLQVHSHHLRAFRAGQLRRLVSLSDMSASPTGSQMGPSQEAPKPRPRPPTLPSLAHHTHTHTYIYICVYIYTLVCAFLSFFWGDGFRISDSRFRNSDLRLRISGSGLQILDFGFRMSMPTPCHLSLFLHVLS